MKTGPFAKSLVAASLVVASLGSLAAVPPELPTGEGMAALQSFDPARRTVMYGQRPVGLAPEAALSLEQQLLLQGRQFGPPFTAKFTVVRDKAGQPVIDSVYVMPKKRR